MRHHERTGPPAEASESFEWVNAWAAQAAGPRDQVNATPREATVVPLRLVAEPDSKPVASEESAPPVAKPRDNQMVLDILEIMRARDALVQSSRPTTSSTSPILVKAHRTGDSVPIVLGSVMGLLMVIVFTAAAAFVKLAR